MKCSSCLQFSKAEYEQTNMELYVASGAKPFHRLLIKKNCLLLLLGVAHNRGTIRMTVGISIDCCSPVSNFIHRSSVFAIMWQQSKLKIYINSTSQVWNYCYAANFVIPSLIANVHLYRFVNGNIKLIGSSNHGVLEVVSLTTGEFRSKQH